MQNLYQQRSVAPPPRTLREKFVGGISRISAGLFGSSYNNPDSQLSSPVQVEGDTRKEGGFYHLHETQLITPGAMNWALDPFQETPLQTVWGNAFLRRANTFNPLQPPQVMATHDVPNAGIGGLIAGQMVGEPLQIPSPEQGA